MKTNSLTLLKSYLPNKTTGLVWNGSAENHQSKGAIKSLVNGAATMVVIAVSIQTDVFQKYQEREKNNSD